MDCLYRYAWPGNVRELENLIERVVVVTPGDIITPDTLPAQMTEKASRISGNGYGQASLKASLAELEKSIISQVLSEQGSTRKAARILGVNQSTIVRKTKLYGIHSS